jgi:hypothetical protein
MVQLPSDYVLLHPAVLCRALALTGKTQRCLNLGSYNYLGFANQDPYCTPHVLEALDTYGWAACSPRAEAGRFTSLHAAKTYNWPCIPDQLPPAASCPFQMSGNVRWK